MTSAAVWQPDVALRWQCFPKPNIIWRWHILLHSEWKVNWCLTSMFSFLQLTERPSVSPLPLFSYPAAISGILFVKPLTAGLICHSPLAEPLPLPGLSPMGVMVLPFYLLLRGRVVFNNETKRHAERNLQCPTNLQSSPSSWSMQGRKKKNFIISGICLTSVSGHQNSAPTRFQALLQGDAFFSFDMSERKLYFPSSVCGPCALLKARWINTVTASKANTH